MPQLKNIFYHAFLGLAATVVLLFDWMNLNELLKRIQGQATDFSQMSCLSDKEAVLYSIAFVVAFLVLTILLFYSSAKKKRIAVIVLSQVILILASLELFTDYLMRCKI